MSSTITTNIMASKTPISARRKLELSQLNPNAVQQGGMGTDVDFQSLLAYFSSAIAIPDLTKRVTSANIVRTIEGASTLTLDINDYDRALLRSGLLVDRLDVPIDGMWFRLTTVDKSGDTVTLTFEDREIAILRTYNKWKIALRGQMTRAEFILSMIREVKEFTIPVNIPELHRIQPIERYSGDLVGIDSIITKSKGIAKDVNTGAKTSFNHRETVAGSKAIELTVKGAPADETQINNANIIMSVGNAMGVSRRLKVIAIMVAITETLITNEPGGEAAHNTTNDVAGDDSAGVFQQRPSWGSYVDRTTVETSARLFYQRAIPVEQQQNTSPYWAIADSVQHSEFPTASSKWRTEAERFVNAFGDVTSVPAANNMAAQQSAFSDPAGAFYFYRGNIQDKNGKQVRKPETTWDCAQRLVDEVDWRAFFVSGLFNLMSEVDLFQQLPLATITEFSPGVNAVDGNYDRNQKTASITLKVDVGRWLVPPGSVVSFKDMGVFDGRWVVNEFDRDLIGDSIEATVTLKKPRPQLPEPGGTNASDINASWAPKAGDSSILPPTNELESRVLQSRNIHFSNDLERSDIQFGKIDVRVMQFLLWMVARGYDITISALRSDHSTLTTEGRISAHSAGLAVDLSTFNSSNLATPTVMKLLAANKDTLGFDQLIGPYPLLCLPLGIYDAKTLAEHKSHIHVGWSGTFEVGHG